MADNDPEIRSNFNTEQGFVDVLFGIGVGDNERNRMIDVDGFDSVQTFVTHYENDMDGLKSYLRTLNKTHGGPNIPEDKRISFSPLITSRIMGLLHYSTVCYYNFHVIPDMRLVKPAKAVAHYKNYKTLNSKSESELDSDIDSTIPDFKGASNWRSFRDKISLKLSGVIGESGIPIDYVIDETPRLATRGNAQRITISEIDISDEGVYRQRTVHFGDRFKADNKRVWKILKTILLNNSAYNHILKYDSTSNGRGAWITLKTFYEGEDFTQRLEDEAFSILSHTNYKGETTRFNFEQFVNRHLKAHKLLLEAGYNNSQGMDESTKIQHLKRGIKAEAGLEHALSSSRTNGLLRGTFQALVSFLAAEVHEKRARKEELGSRVRVAEINSKSNINYKKGRNTKVDLRGKLNEIVEGKRIESRLYSKDEWKSLSRAQKTAVIRLNRKARKGPNKPFNRGDQNKINAIQSSINDLTSVSEAIVAAMTKVKGEPPSDSHDDVSELTDIASLRKRKAKSGSVGDYIAKARK